LYYDLKLTFPI